MSERNTMLPRLVRATSFCLAGFVSFAGTAYSETTDDTHLVSKWTVGITGFLMGNFPGANSEVAGAGGYFSFYDSFDCEEKDENWPEVSFKLNANEGRKAIEKAALYWEAFDWVSLSVLSKSAPNEVFQTIGHDIEKLYKEFHSIFQHGAKKIAVHSECSAISMAEVNTDILWYELNHLYFIDLFFRMRIAEDQTHRGWVEPHIQALHHLLEAKMATYCWVINSTDRDVGICEPSLFGEGSLLDHAKISFDLANRLGEGEGWLSGFKPSTDNPKFDTYHKLYLSLLDAERKLLNAAWESSLKPAELAKILGPIHSMSGSGNWYWEYAELLFE